MVNLHRKKEEKLLCSFVGNAGRVLAVVIAELC